MMLNRLKKKVVLIAAMICLAAAGPVAAEDYLNQGRDQLVDALDAAIARVVASGKFRQILASDPAAGALIVEIADCYPRIMDGTDEIYPFPKNPTGLLADILTSRQIRMGTFDVVSTPGTFHVFDTINPALMRAIIDELGKGYGIPPYPAAGSIQIVKVFIWPPSSSLVFTGLNNGDYDITDFLGALGATASVNGVEARRRKLARFTCTAFGTPWYIHVRNDSPHQTFDDVVADTTADICVGQLSARLSEDFFPNAHSVTPQFFDDDLVVCSEGVRDGTYDAYFHFDPEPYLPELRSIPMQIASGIPIWVAGDMDRDRDRIPDAGDNCPDNFNPWQTDTDGDGVGDPCDCADTDADGICDGEDNCPGVCNPLQLDYDMDGLGDLCDSAPGCTAGGCTPCEAACPAP